MYLDILKVGTKFGTLEHDIDDFNDFDFKSQA